MTTTDNGPLPSFLMDMDGVLVHEEEAIPGADRFIKALEAAELPFLVLTNNSIYTPRDLSARLARTSLPSGGKNMNRADQTLTATWGRSTSLSVVRRLTTP